MAILAMLRTGDQDVDALIFFVLGLVAVFFVKYVIERLVRYLTSGGIILQIQFDETKPVERPLVVRRNSTLGLHLVHDAPKSKPQTPTSATADLNPFSLISMKPRVVDVVFVHGLGGCRLETWTYQSEQGMGEFWPSWLRDEPGLGDVRVSTFGYDADTSVIRGGNKLGIEEFARQLLDSLSHHYEACGNVAI